MQKYKTVKSTHDNSSLNNKVPSSPATYHHSHIAGYLSDDSRFLIACCQANPSEEEIDFIKNSLPAIDCQQLVGIASRHGVLPLVYKTLKNLSQSGKADFQDFLSELKPINMSIAQRNMLMSSELIKIMRLLEENHIEALAFKGPALAQMAYGDITLRQYSDLDILVERAQVHRIAFLLKEEGYVNTLSLSSAQQEQVWYQHAKDMVFFHPQRRIILELHWLLLDDDYPVQMDLDVVWREQKTIQINGYDIQTFSSETLLLYLCIHGSKHLWERIGWIKDIDLMIRTQKIDWEHLAVFIRGSGFERMFLLGLHLTNTLFDTPLPKTVKEQIHDQKWLRELSDYIMDDWTLHRNMFHNSAAMLHLFPILKMKLQYLHKVIMRPSKNEYRFVDLPKKFYWAYYLLRPYLLIRKYLRPTD